MIALSDPASRRRARPQRELECRLETLALSGRAAGDIGEEFLAPGFFERIALQLELLILGADAGVTDEHGKSVLEDAFLKPIRRVFGALILERVSQPVQAREARVCIANLSIPKTFIFAVTKVATRIEESGGSTGLSSPLFNALQPACTDMN